MNNLFQNALTALQSVIVTNGPDAPAIQVNDLVVASDGKRMLRGYVESIDNGNFKMWNGPTFPTSAVYRFIQRKGNPFVKGNDSLPTEIL